MVRYLGQLTVPRFVLWAYLIWWCGAAIPYFDPSPTLWASSVGMSAVIGTGLYLSTAHAGPARTHLGPWAVARLYMMPFFVSSFAALIKGRGFILIFHPTVAGNVPPILVSLVLGVLAWLCRAVQRRGKADTRKGKRQQGTSLKETGPVPPER